MLPARISTAAGLVGRILVAAPHGARDAGVVEATGTGCHGTGPLRLPRVLLVSLPLCLLFVDAIQHKKVHDGIAHYVCLAAVSLIVPVIDLVCGFG